MHQVTVFQCDHCKCINISQRNMRRHELRCHLNHANRSCATCRHLETADIDYDVFLDDEEVDSRSKSGPWCAEKNEKLYPLQTKCDKWEALPNGGASAYFAQQANYAMSKPTASVGRDETRTEGVREL